LTTVKASAHAVAALVFVVGVFAGIWFVSHWLGERYAVWAECVVAYLETGIDCMPQRRMRLLPDGREVVVEEPWPAEWSEKP
jgi:hypothetical protein